MIGKDQVLMRTKDLSLLLLLLSVLGLVLGPIKRVFRMDETITKVEKLEEKVNKSQMDIAVIGSQYADITKQLDNINWQLRRMRDGK